MPLRFDLGPFERLFIGKSILTNHGDRTTLVLEGESPILRAKDVLSPQSATTSLRSFIAAFNRCTLKKMLKNIEGHTLHWWLKRFPKPRISKSIFKPQTIW